MLWTAGSVVTHHFTPVIFWPKMKWITGISSPWRTFQNLGCQLWVAGTIANGYPTIVIPAVKDLKSKSSRTKKFERMSFTY